MATSINDLLDDKLYQVIGSTPASIAESLRKVDLKGKSKTGAQIFAVSIFAAAVNKSTLETFLADPRFVEIRPLISAAMSIQGRSNMTALTLLGHCFLTTRLADDVKFAAEFRKKMGQNHLWSGELSSGSLSQKQREILMEKKRVTDLEAATALGTGFLKWVGLDNKAMNNLESVLFGFPIRSSSESSGSSFTAAKGKGRDVTTAEFSEAGVETVTLSRKGKEPISIPKVLYDYRKDKIDQTETEIYNSAESRGINGFIDATTKLMARDPEGKKIKSGSTIV